jgi:hypothetical protein
MTAQGGTLLWPLALEFPGDPACAAVADQFLFGPALMACPITRSFRHAPAETTSPRGQPPDLLLRQRLAAGADLVHPDPR